jgi:hypothetical protein
LPATADFGLVRAAPCVGVVVERRVGAAGGRCWAPCWVLKKQLRGVRWLPLVGWLAPAGFLPGSPGMTWVTYRRCELVGGLGSGWCCCGGCGLVVG